VSLKIIQFSGINPNVVAVNAARMLFEQCGIELGKIQPNYEILGHRQSLQAQTDCPGDSLYSLIQTWPNWAPIIP